MYVVFNVCSLHMQYYSPLFPFAVMFISQLAIYLLLNELSGSF